MNQGSAKRKSILGENLSLKLISLILAVLLELYFYSADNSIKAVLSASVEVKGLPESMMVVNFPNGNQIMQSRVELRGPRPLIEQVRTSALKFAVEYPKDQPPIYTALLNTRQLGLPSGVEVTDVSPATITIEVEKTHSRELPVAVDREGEPEPGFRLEAMTVQPSLVRVTGAARIVESLQSIVTQEVDISALTESKRMEVLLLAPSPLVSLSAKTAAVEARIAPIQAERVLDAVNLSVLAPAGFAGSVEPSKVKVILSGPERLLDSLAGDSVKLVADAHALPEGKHEVEVSGDLPAGISVLETKPKKVFVTLVKQDG